MLLRIFSILLILALTCSYANHRHALQSDSKTINYTQSFIAKQLNWTPLPITPANLCGGYFKEPAIVANTPTPGPIAQQVTHIHSQGPTVYYSKKHYATLKEDVTVTQPGRIIKADLAYLIKDPTTGDLTEIELIGHVHLEEHNHHVYGTHGYLNLKTNLLTINHSIYQLYRPSSQQGQKGHDAWGQSSYFYRDTHNVWHFKNATYTISSPLHPSWQLHAERLRYNKQEQVVYAHNVWFDMYGVPLLYTPYFSFSTNNQRKSGFLLPSPHFSSKNGIDISLPYYFNLAPNYDDLLTPRYISKRGFLVSNLFRLLTPHSMTDFGFSFMPHDRLFAEFKETAPTNFPSSLQPYLNKLSSYSDSRYYLHLDNKIHLDRYWNSELHLNYTGDPYFLNDVNSINLNNQTINGIASQLRNQFDLHYQGPHWNFTALAQAYQTLHQINQTPVSDQFRRLPEFDLGTDYPDFLGNLSFNFTSQWVNFDYPDSGFTDPIPTIGQRLHLAPSLSLPMNWTVGYIHPQITLDNTDYENKTLVNQVNTRSQSRTTPIIDVDTGLFFDRDFHLFNTTYRQTLEPRLFYLYVPYQNQSDLPIYDTILLPFSYDQLFSTNAYTGFDRIQNANQLTFALSSSIYNEQTGRKQLDLSAGIIDYFSKPKVCLTPDCQLTTHSFSPLVGTLDYYPFTHWTLSLNAAWDPQDPQLTNATGSIAYDVDSNHTIKFGYNYIAGSTPANDSRYLTTSFSWRVLNHWQVFNYLYYNLEQNYPQSLLGGIEYDTCGWALRFFATRTFNNISYNGNQISNQFDNGFVIQWQLKGLGSVGNSPDLLSNISGYQDTFNNITT